MNAGILMSEDTRMSVATHAIEGMVAAILMTKRASMDAIGARVESGGVGKRKRNMSLVLGEEGRTALHRCRHHWQHP
jgi:hypothetical protein